MIHAALAPLVASLQPRFEYPLEGYKAEFLCHGDEWALTLRSPFPAGLRFYKRLDEMPETTGFDPVKLSDYFLTELDALVAHAKRKMLRTPRCYFNA